MWESEFSIKITLYIINFLYIYISLQEIIKTDKN